MTAPDKDKINRVIAEAMGWIGIYEGPRKKLVGYPPKCYGRAALGLIPTPSDSDADFWAAVDKILPEDIHVVMSWTHERTVFTISRFNEKTDIRDYWGDFKTKTRLEAGCLALVDYIKKEKEK